VTNAFADRLTRAIAGVGRTEIGIMSNSATNSGSPFAG
jgi:hypothetical protein